MPALNTNEKPAHSGIFFSANGLNFLTSAIRGRLTGITIINTFFISQAGALLHLFQSCPPIGISPLSGMTNALSRPSGDHPAQNILDL
jgi:hypothetical protein